MSTQKWIELGINEPLAMKLASNGIIEPTAIQAEAMPILLEGNDVSARSQTGTGKTLAYLLPMLQQMNAESSSLQGVILAPTQELAMQIVRVAETYAEPLNLRVQQLIGGAALKRQVEKLKLRPHLAIGTPGRIHELLKLRKLKLHDVRFIIIDEADQVFELGSTKEVETILHGMSKIRQLAFFSATYPEQMARFEGRWMKDPVRIQIAPEHRVSETIDNYYLVSDKRDKTDTARRIIRLLNPTSALLFINTTDNISNWESKLSYEGFTVEAIFGDADKQRRAATLARFREGRCQLLLATDVAARGLDIEGLPLVINLDPPVDADHYVHRAGRTGRMGRPGTVVSIVTPQELFIMDKFRKQLGIDFPEKAMFKGKLVAPDQIGKSNPYFGNKGSKPGRTDERKATVKSAESVKSPEVAPQSETVLKKASLSNVTGSEDTSRSNNRVGEASAQSSSNRRSESPVKRSAEKDKPKVAAKPIAPVKQKQERHRAKKDKGAPKWLKEKRETKVEEKE